MDFQEVVKRKEELLTAIEALDRLKKTYTINKRYEYVGLDKDVPVEVWYIKEDPPQEVIDILKQHSGEAAPNTVGNNYMHYVDCSGREYSNE